MAANQTSAQARGIVVILEGKAWLVDATGTRRPLKVGDEVQEGQQVITEDGCRLELALPNGQPLIVASGRELLIDATLLGTARSDKSEASLTDLNSGSAEVTRIIASGGDLSTELESTALGLGGGDGSDSHSFVRLLRIQEDVSPLTIARSDQPADAPIDFLKSIGQAVSVEDPTPSIEVPAPVPAQGTTPVPTPVPVPTPSPVPPPPPAVSANDPPVAVNDSGVTNEDTPVTFTAASLLGNDSDVDGDTLSITSVQGATNGTVSLVGGSAVFTPTANYNGPASFTYTISDGKGGTTTAAVNLTVIAVADTPNLAVTNSGAQVFNTNWETAANSDNTSQPNSGPTLESWKLIYPTGTTGGVPTVADTYGTNGVNRFETWTVNDQMSNQAGNLVTINTVPIGNGTTFLELNNASSTTLPQTLGIERTVVTQANKVYELSFDYAGRLGYDVTYTKINVLVNGASIGTYASTSPLTTLDWQNLAFSFQGSGSDTIRVLTDATTFDANGRGAMIDDINLRYAQGAIQGNAVGGTQTSIGLSQYVTTSLNDTDGSESLAVTFNGIPAGSVITTASNPTGITPVGGTVTISQADLASAQILLPATHVGTVSLGVVSTATEASNSSAATNTATLNLEVLNKGVTVTDLVDGSVNRAPDAKNDAPTTVLVEAAATNTLTGQAITGGSGNVTDTDPNAGATLRVTGLVAGVGSTPAGTNAIASPVTVAGRYGSLQIAANGSYTYTLDNNNANTKALISGQVGYDVFTYKIQDGQGGYDTATINITVNGTSPAVVNLLAPLSAAATTSNAAPVASNDSVSTTVNSTVTLTSSSLLSNDSDPDGNALSVTSVQGATNGTVSLVSGNALFTPTPNYTGTGSFSYTISDGNNGSSTGAVNVAITPANRSPVASNDSASTTANTSVTIAVLSNDTDPDGDVLSISSVLDATNGSATIVGDSVVFTPTKDYSGAASFNYTISDGHGGTSTASVNLTVDPANHTPVASGDSASTTANQSVTIAVLSNDTDPDGDPLSITSVLDVSNGSVAVSGSSVVFTPTKDFVGTGSLTYNISDGHGGTSSASVSITIAADLLKAGTTPV